jgi:hypothetical protein
VGNCVFIFGGQFVADKLNNNNNIINWIIGGIFAITAIIQLWKILTKKDVAHKIEHPEEMTHGMEEKIEKLVEEAEKTLTKL